MIKKYLLTNADERRVMNLAKRDRRSYDTEEQLFVAERYNFNVDQEDFFLKS